MKRLSLLDYGRFLAVLGVVVFHYAFSGLINGKISISAPFEADVGFAKYGYLGVELFFMISGYAISMSAQNKTALSFLKNRFVRIYPAYFFSVIFTSVVSFFWAFDVMRVSLEQVFVNLLMLQYLFGVSHVDGVYWSLFYEMVFYFVVFTLIFLGFRKHLRVFFIVFPVFFSVLYLSGFETGFHFGGYCYYFSAGSLFYFLSRRMGWDLVLALFFCYLCSMYFSIDKAESLGQAYQVGFSPWVVGGAVTCFYAFFILQGFKCISALELPWAGVLGALTYPMYLLHAHFGYMFINRFANENNLWIIAFLSFLVVLGVSMFVHFYWEKKIVRLLN